jgi:hypothetical protein
MSIKAIETILYFISGYKKYERQLSCRIRILSWFNAGLVAYLSGENDYLDRFII